MVKLSHCNAVKTHININSSVTTAYMHRVLQLYNKNNHYIRFLTDDVINFTNYACYKLYTLLYSD